MVLEEKPVITIKHTTTNVNLMVALSVNDQS